MSKEPAHFTPISTYCPIVDVPGPIQKDSILPSFLTTIRLFGGLSDWGVNKAIGIPSSNPTNHTCQSKRRLFFFFFFLGVTFHKNFCKLYFLLVLSLIGCFLPIFGCVFFHPLSSTLYLFLPLLAFCQFWVVSFHPLFTCSFPYGLSANFGCFNSSTLYLFFPLWAFCQFWLFQFIHFHPLFTCSFPIRLSVNFGWFFYPLSSTLYLFFPLLAFCQFWLFFSFIHFHPLFEGARKGLEL